MIRRSAAAVGLLLALKTGLFAHPHPLDPLTTAEITAAVEIMASSGSAAGLLYPYIALQEPPKAEVLAHKSSAAFIRRAQVVSFDRKANLTREAVVDLTNRRIDSSKKISSGQPNILLGEFADLPDLVRADPRWQAAMKRRGIKNPQDPHEIWIDMWAPGPLSSKESASGARLVRAVSYRQEGTDNPYAQPIEGVIAIVDANAWKVDSVVDSGVVAIPPQTGSFSAGSVQKTRAGLKPLSIAQPEGPSFDAHGRHVKWQNWDFRFALHPREGLVLYTVGYQDGERLRSVLYRASLSEMLVPYADPDPAWSFRNAFDEGEYGIGRTAGTLDAGLDVPENAQFFDAAFADDAGKTTSIPRAVALFERDGRVLWKHRDMLSGINEARRGRELVLFFITTLSNYDYGMAWVFHQDGTLSMEAGLTGIMLAKGVNASSGAHHGGDLRFGHLVAPNVLAVHHQHFFNFRLDFDIDGASNTVIENNCRALPSGADNPLGGAFVMEDTAFKREKEARRSLNLESARKWRVVNPGSLNSLGQPTGYTLVAGENAKSYLQPSSPVRRRGRFLENHLWVTPYRREELYAAGDFPNQGPPGQGLPAWTDQSRPIENTDVVLWYTFGITHTPRPEDWPVMPTHWTGFKLVPTGFFDRNPALDVPVSGGR